MTSLDAIFADAVRVADAVVLEGYVLYPYRSSSTKNRVRWQYGVLAPRTHSEATGTDPWLQRTECLVDVSEAVDAEVGDRPRLAVRVRALQVQARQVQAAGVDGFTPVDALEVDGTRWTSWDEGVHHQVDVQDVDLSRPGGDARLVELALPASEEIEELRAADGSLAGRIVRRCDAVQATIGVDVLAVDGEPRLRRVRVEVVNVTDWCEPHARRDQSLSRCLTAVHAMFATAGADFVSLMDPAEHARDAAAACDNVGTFPVLAGDEGTADVVLSSPIILYDHPEIAPESPGDFCDSTEIDEILALRVLTLTDEEKREARSTDARAAAIIDRCDNMAPEVFERLHGAIRSLGEPEPAGAGNGGGGGADEALPWWEPAVDASVDPWSDRIPIGDLMVGKGAKVRLHPRSGGDAQDLFLVGMAATVAGVFADVDGGRHVAVTLDDDPAAELNLAHGRFRYFHPDEIEPLEGAS